MANAYVSTDSASLGGTAGAAGLVQKAYDRLLEFALRSEPLIRSVADKRPTNQSIPGSTVVLQRYVDLTATTTPLEEAVDKDAVAMTTPTTVTITLNEYGNSVLVTRALELFSLADVDPAIANIIAFNLADSIDAVAMTTLRGGSNVIYSGSTATSTATVTAAATLSSANIRKAVAKLRANKSIARKGSLYWAGIHPEVSHDLRAETGSAGWLLPNQYGSAQDRIWAGEIGTYEGAYFVESPRLYSNTDGASSAKVYRTILAGQQAMAEAVAEEPHVVIGPVVDKLMRHRPMGWYGVLGFARYREEALYRIESGSSIAQLIDGWGQGNLASSVSSLRRTMANYTFRTPYVLEGPSGGHRLFYFANLRKGVSVAKSGGTYSLVRYVPDDTIKDYQEFYSGGCLHTVDDATKAALIAGGIGITEANFTAQQGTI